MLTAIVLAAVAASALIAISSTSSAAGVTFTVDSTADDSDANLADNVCDTGSGVCTLRAAIEQANATAGDDTISFNLPAVPATIAPAACLPILAGTTYVDATTQPGYSGTPVVELSGDVSGCTRGIDFHAGGSLLGFAIGGFDRAVFLSIPSSGVTIAGNYIGFTPAGSGHSNQRGIEINSSFNIIGGSTPSERNVIAHSSDISIAITGLFGATGNAIKGNYIGTDPTGAVRANSGSGIVISDGASSTTIGGPGEGEGNVISGNGTGILVNGDNTTIQGNYIGTDLSGTFSVYNGSGGIQIDSGSGNEIGGDQPGEGNLISGNLNDAISAKGDTVIQGNFIGTDVTGIAPLPNTGKGIHLNGNGAGPGQIGGSTEAARNVVVASSSAGIFVEGSAIVQGNYVGLGSDGLTVMPNGASGSQGVFVINSNDVLIGGDQPGQGNLIADGLWANGVTGGLAIYGNDISTVDGGSAIWLYRSSDVQVGGTGAGMGNIISGSNIDGVLNQQTTSGNPGLHNSIRGNSIHDNGGLGINNDGGANLELSPPVINDPNVMAGTACANCIVDIYSDAEDEGAFYHGFTTADSNGDWTFSGAVVGPNVTATATDADGNTSEFSAAVPCQDTDLDSVCDAGDSDDDNDGNPDASDGCPLVVTPWTTPIGDGDCDGFTDALEATVLTLSAQACGFTPGGDPASESWPPDLIESNSITISDVLAFKPFFGSSVPPTSARYDLAQNGSINISDVLALKPYFGLSCTP